jgi:hypothetical protein
MSECGLSIGCEADGQCEVYSIRYVRAKKEHICSECRKVIAVGEVYEYHFSVYEGDALTIKTCSICAEIRDAFTEPGSAICPGEMWGEIKSYVFPEIKTSCYDRLSTPLAKAKLQLMWMKWKGLL